MLSSPFDVILFLRSSRRRSEALVWIPIVMESRLSSPIAHWLSERLSSEEFF